MENCAGFFSNKECRYFPCHETKKTEDFNCMFCYCPLYYMDMECGGNYKLTDNGIKDCTDCLVPHGPNSQNIIVNKIIEYNDKLHKDS